MFNSETSFFENKKATILIVEDERIVARDLQATLEEMGYCVPDIVDSGELAIQRALDLRPDLILMDIHLVGKIDGITAAQEISMEAGTPIIYVTAHADMATLARTKLTGPFGYILKPFEEYELRITIEIALHKNELGKKFRERTQWLIAILRNMGDGVIATDIRGVLTFVNPTAQVILGCSLQEIFGRHVSEVFSLYDEKSKAPVKNPILEVLETGNTFRLSEFGLISNINGKEVSISDSVAPIRNSSGDVIGAVMVFQDNTERRIFEAQLTHQAFHDNLTGLPNRALFLLRLEEEIKRARRDPEYRFAVLFLDLDRFKYVNDSLGHLVGDRLLVAIAERLRHAVRDIDSVARLGGDEFAILLTKISDLVEVFQVAERILKTVQNPVVLGGTECVVGVSIGITLSTLEKTTSEDILQEADIALYRAKNSGRSRYEVFDRVMGDQVKACLLIETSLRHALETGELQPAFQPIIDMTDGRICGIEALMRWQKQGGDIVSPGDFIQIAEESGLIVLADWVIMRAACQQVRKWQQENLLTDQWISVNVSGQQFSHQNFVAQVESVLRETGLQPASLKLEITETSIIQHPESAIEILTQLKALGIRIALDDFGTGYSSLSYLHRFPVDSLKIDRSFVRQITLTQQSAEIIRTVVLLAKALSMETIAEGVETEEQKAFLLELNCSLAQGFLFQKPLLAREMTMQLRKFLNPLPE